MLDSSDDGVVVWRKRLHEDAPPLVAAPRAAGHLRHELKGSFRRPQVAKMKRRVGVDNADQRHVREIKPLGDHLRTQQYFHLAGAKAIERGLVAPGLLHRVAIHAYQRHIGKAAPDFRLEPLGAKALKADA